MRTFASLTRLVLVGMKARDPHFHPDVVPRKPGYLTAHRRQVKQGDRSFPMNRDFSVREAERIILRRLEHASAQLRASPFLNFPVETVAQLAIRAR